MTLITGDGVHVTVEGFPEQRRMPAANGSGSGGSFGGRTLLASARDRWRELLSDNVLAAQGLYGRFTDWLFWDGKEKVYGSIP